MGLLLVLPVSSRLDSGMGMHIVIRKYLCLSLVLLKFESGVFLNAYCASLYLRKCLTSA